MSKQLKYIDSVIANLINKRLPGFNIECILDVGANVGQSSHCFRHFWPDATIIAFEPIRESFLILEQEFIDDKKISCFNIGLGKTNGPALMYSEGTSPGNRKVPGSVPNPERNVELADFLSGDDFFYKNQLNKINYLKIDTEGYDLDVLCGFSKCLAGHKIDLIQLEVGLHPKNLGHVSLEKAKIFLESYNYLIFQFVDQTFETRGLGHLRRCDTIFVSDTCVKSYLMRS